MSTIDFLCRKGKPHGYKLVERPIDISDVIDVDNPESLLAAGSTLLEHTNLPGLPHCCRIFTFPERPGLVFFRKGLDPDLQRRLTIQCLTQFPSPPAHTNFNRSLDRSLPPGLWEAAQTGLRLSPVPEETSEKKEQQQPHWVKDSDGPPATTLLKKLRWSSIGLIYDWTRRIYVSEWVFIPLPEELATLAKNLVRLSSLATKNQTPIAPTKETTDETTSKSAPFIPDAALINYYHEGDTLNGHIDDAEPDITQPLVSLSLGRPGIFLVGGFTKDITPIPVLLRSGDAVVLDGDSRRCYHGVPRIFPLKVANNINTSNEKDGEQGKKESNNDGGGGDFLTNLKKGKAMSRPLLAPECEKTDWGECIEDSSVDFGPFEQHMNGCRINVSIRSVGGGGAGKDLVNGG